MKTRIKEELIIRGLTQKYVADAIGMSEPGLSKAINGSATPVTIGKIARYLNMNVEDLLVADTVLSAKFSSDKSPLKLGHLEIPCYVLEDGTRVLSGRAIQKSIGYESKSGQWMKSFANLPGIKELFYAGDFSIIDQLSHPIKFKRNDAGGSQSITNGYEATLLIDICTAIIDANRAGNFNNIKIVVNAETIIKAVAKVGIIALIDEATGYDREKDRGKDELQKFLSQFISEEASKWVKTFPDYFFEMIYKMNGWNWSGTSKRPGVVGKWINDIIYDRLAPNLLIELQSRNPKNANGERLVKHHQLLTPTTGHPRLREHIEGVMAVSRLSDGNWKRFIDNLDKAYPRLNNNSLTLD